MDKRNLEDVLDFNKQFIEKKEYLKYQSTKTPDRKIAIVTCMDTRLTELLPQAMNIKNGDAKIIKNAGGMIIHPFGSIMRSLIIAIYKLEVNEVFIVPHYDCGVCRFDTTNIKTLMKERGIAERDIEIVENSGINIEKWLHGFDEIEEALEKSIAVVKNHPLMPKGIPVHGLIIDPRTGKLDLKINGWDDINLQNLVQRKKKNIFTRIISKLVDRHSKM